MTGLTCKQLKFATHSDAQVWVFHLDGAMRSSPVSVEAPGEFSRYVNRVESLRLYSK